MIKNLRFLDDEISSMDNLSKESYLMGEMLPRAKTGIVLLCNRLNAGKVIDKMWQELNDCKTGKIYDI